MIAEGGTLCAGLSVKAVLLRCGCLQGVRIYGGFLSSGFAGPAPASGIAMMSNLPVVAIKALAFPTGFSCADYCRVIAESGVLACRRIATVVTAYFEHYAPLGVTPRRYSCASKKSWRLFIVDMRTCFAAGSVTAGGGGGYQLCDVMWRKVQPLVWITSSRQFL